MTEYWQYTYAVDDIYRNDGFIGPEAYETYRLWRDHGSAIDEGIATTGEGWRWGLDYDLAQGRLDKKKGYTPLFRLFVEGVSPEKISQGITWLPYVVGAAIVGAAVLYTKRRKGS